MPKPHDTRQLAIRFELFRVRFMDELAHEMVEEFLPLVASFVPDPQRTARESGAAAWQAYVETESGELHAYYLERLVRDPDTTIKLEDAASHRPALARSRARETQCTRVTELRITGSISAKSTGVHGKSFGSSSPHRKQARSSGKLSS